MENFPLRGVTLVEEPASGLNATPVLLATLKRLRSQQFSIVAVATGGDERELGRWFKRAEIDDVRFVSVPIEDFGRLTEIVEAELRTREATEKRVIFVSNADILRVFLGSDSTARVLYRLGVDQPLLTRLFHDSCTPLELERFCSVCANVLHLFVADGQTICKTTTRKKDGTYGRTVEQFAVDSTHLSIRAHAYEPPKFRLETDETTSAPSSVLPKTTFDMGLNLSADEQRAKRATKLPYTSAQKEDGLVSLNIGAGKTIRAGGQIIYTPDAMDDLDDSDPDEDLMI